MSGDQVAHLAVALKGLPPNAEKSLEELAPEALRFLLYCEALVQSEERRLSDERIAKAHPISDQEAALILMPKDKDPTRRLERLKEFRDYFKQPNELMNAEDSHRMQIDPWTKGRPRCRRMETLRNGAFQGDPRSDGELPDPSPLERLDARKSWMGALILQMRRDFSGGFFLKKRAMRSSRRVFLNEVLACAGALLLFNDSSIVWSASLVYTTRIDSIGPVLYQLSQ
jgi:hypothetical protein